MTNTNFSTPVRETLSDMLFSVLAGALPVLAGLLTFTLFASA
ncbi:MAG TPA: hypothetical protein VGU69_01500 [Rhizomicrobium sp.]|nr:hypothetical protein [Rhizomicrobium sp.]